MAGQIVKVVNNTLPPVVSWWNFPDVLAMLLSETVQLPERDREAGIGVQFLIGIQVKSTYLQGNATMRLQVNPKSLLKPALAALAAVGMVGIGYLGCQVFGRTAMFTTAGCLGGLGIPLNLCSLCTSTRWRKSCSHLTT